MRDLLYDVVQEVLSLALHDKESIPRQLLAIMARSEAKNFFALHVGTELEKFERELEARAQRKLADLGSAGLPATPTVDQHAAETARMLHGIPDDAPLPQCLTDVCLQRFATCTDCTIPNRENP